MTLPIEALLLGHTTKADNPKLRGKHGEGLDLGLLALVRAGRSVRIRSGAEVWVPSLEKSSKFNGATVLVVDVQKGRTYKNRVRVEIEGVEDDEWTDMKSRFLFLQKLKNNEFIKTYSGTLLLKPEQRGHLFVKGIWVMTDPKLNYGYDYRDAELDRDRRMINSWDIQFKNAKIWREAATARPDLFDKFVEMLEEGIEDVTGFEGSATDYMEPELVEQVAARFIGRHGDKAVPVDTLEQSKNLEHLGRKGVIVPKALSHIVKKTLGSIEKITEELRGEVLATYSWHDLTAEEKTYFEESVSMIEEANPMGCNDIFGNIDIVDFKSDDLMGQHKDGRYLVAKKLLADRDELLATLIHEVAHDAGADGDHDHVAALESIWSNVVSKLRDL